MPTSLQWALLLLTLGLGMHSAKAEKSAEGRAHYQVQVPSSLVVALEAEQNLPITILPSEGFRVSRHAPLRIDIRLPSDSKLSVKKTRLSRRELKDKASLAPHFQVALRGKSLGSESLVIAYRFWLCRSKICRPIQGETSVQVTIEAAEKSEPGPSDAGVQAPTTP